MNTVRKVRVPHYTLSKKNYIKVEMHEFADALERAFGCCICVRPINENDDVTVQLWSAKSRVATLKIIVRLELMVAHLLASLIVKTQ